MTKRLLAIILAVVAAAVADAGADAGKGGPSPGVVTGWNGVLASKGATRFVALPTGRATTVVAVRVRGGTVLRHSTLRGVFGVPLVAYDGSTSGLSHDGRTLVLASPTPTTARGAATRFAVVATKNLRLRSMITLPGSWSFDAVSPDGSRLYLVEHLNAGETPGYRVRAYDVERSRLLSRPVVDRNIGARLMAGQPVTRTTGPEGRWAYTLYRKPGDFPFVHALDTARVTALCIALPWREQQDGLWSVRMKVSPDGRRLGLRQRATRLASIDLHNRTVTSFRKPAA
jgi:hypothetical protein